MMTRAASSVLLLLMVASLMVASVVMAGSRADDLEPSDGLFAEPGSLNYYLALRRGLLAQHDYRRCQVLTAPSFEPEWAVYLIRDDAGPAQVIFKTFKSQLWLQMPENLPQGLGGGRLHGRGPTSLPAVEQTVAVISAPTADLLDRVWTAMLARVRYPETMTLRADGTSYYVSHWQRGIGVRSGKTWSPETQSHGGALVTLATALREYTRAGEDQRVGLEAHITRDATALLHRVMNNR